MRLQLQSRRSRDSRNSQNHYEPWLSVKRGVLEMEVEKEREGEGGGLNMENSVV